MKVGIGIPIPYLSNLPGPSRPGGGGTPVPPGPDPLAQINNVYSMEFDGASDFVLLDNSNDTLNVPYLTISIWFKPDVAGFQCLIGNRYFSSGFMSWALQLSAGNTIRYLQLNPNVGSSFRTTDTYNVGVWNHIAVTYDSGGEVKMYLNAGTPVVATVSGSPIVYSTGFISDNVTIGAAPGGSQYFNGKIDEVGIFNTALTEAEVQSIYNATEVVGGVNKTADLSQLTTPPLKWYRMGD